MNHAWKSINGLVGFTSSFDQLKIQFYTETKKKNRKSHSWKLSITIEKEYIPRLASVYRGGPVAVIKLLFSFQ